MANDFSGSEVFEYFRLEPGALGVGAKGRFNLSVAGVTSETVDFREGSASAKFVAASSQYLSCLDGSLPAGFPLKLGWQGGKLAIAFWFKLNSISLSTRYFFYKGSGQGLSIVSNSINLVTSGSARPLHGSLVAGVWYHLTFFYDTSTGIFWSRLRNGDTQGVGTKYGKIMSGGVWTANNSSLYIGYTGSGTVYFDGLIDELVFFAPSETLKYDDALSIEENTYRTVESLRNISQYTGDSSCVALYRFESGYDFGRDDKGSNLLHKVNYPITGYVVAPHTADKKRGSGCAWFKKNRYCYRSDIDLSDDFPFKGNNANKMISLVLWFKALDVSGEHNLVGKHQRATGASPEFYYYGFRLWTSGTTLNADFQYGTYNQSTETKTLFSGLQANRWYHLAFTYDTLTKTYYAELWDDSTATETTVGPLTTTNTPNMPQASFYVGGVASLSSNDYLWNGYIDELAVFNDNLTAAEIQSIRDGTFSFAADSNCVSLYNFEPSVNFLKDSKGSNHLGVSGNPGANWEYRQEGRACCWAGDTVEYPGQRINEADMDAGFPFLSTGSNNEMSVSFWMRPTRVPTTDGYYKYICGKANMYAGDYDVCWALRFQRLNPNDTIQLLAGYNNGNSWQTVTLYSTPALSLNRWYFVGLSINRTTGAYSFYLYDSVTETAIAQVTGTLANQMSLCDKAFVVGNIYYNDTITSHTEWPFEGYFDEFAVWNRAKSLESFSILKDEMGGPGHPPTEVRQDRIDISGNERHLADNGALQTGNAQGKIGNAAYFSGSGEQLLRLAEAPDLTGDAEFTVAFRMKPHLKSDPGGDIYWHLKIGDLEIKAGFAPGQTKAFVSASTRSLSCNTGSVIPADAFSFIAVYFDTAGLYIDMNDSNKASAAGSGTGIVTPAAEIEAGIGSGIQMSISVDELGIWVGANALSAAQRTTLYSGNYGQRPTFS